MVWSVTRAIGASDHGVWYGNRMLCLTVSRQLSPRQAVSPTLVLCQHGSQGTLLACSSRRRWGSPLSLDRSMSQSVSLVVVGIEVHAWDVLRLPSLHEM